MARLTAGNYLRCLMQPATYFGIGMLIVIYAALAYELAEDRGEAEIIAKGRGESLVNELYSKFGKAFGDIRFNLGHLRREIERNPGNVERADWRADLPANNRYATEYLLADAGGRVLYATDRALAGRTLPALADALDAHKTAGGDETVVGKPFFLDDGAVPKFALSIPVGPGAAAKLNAAIAVAVLDIKRLADSVSGIDLGGDGALILFGKDGNVRLRMVDGRLDRGAVGRELPVDGSVINRLPRAPSGAFWRDKTPFDGKRRLLAYRLLDNVPLGVVVAQSEAEVYRRARDQALIDWAVGLALTAAVLLGVGLGAHREWRLIEIGASADATNAALRQSEERYRKAAAAVDEGLWDWDIKSETVYISPRWKALLGYADEELPNERRTFFDRVHPDDLSVVETATRAHFDEGKAYDIEFRLRRRDGQYIWVHSRGKADRDAAGRPVRMVGTVADISERKQAEENLRAEIRQREAAQAALQVSEERYRKVEDALGEGVWDLNMVTGDYHLSPRWKEILGFHDHELRNTREEFYQRIHPDDDARVRAAVAAHLEHDVPYRLDLRLRCKDGSYKWVHTQGRAERDANGKPVRILGTSKDISDRKLAEEKLQEESRRREAAQTALRISEERYRKVEAALGEGVWDLNMLTGDYHLSPRWKEILGFRDHELRSAREEFYQRIHPDDDAKVRAALVAHLEHDVPYRLDLRLRCKDGSYKWIHTRGKAERAADGKPVRMLGTIEDISDRKLAEEKLQEESRRREAAQAELAKVNAELEQRIAVRSEQLASEMRRREEAQMRLAQVHKLDAVGQLTAGIAHDFNNLLSVINGGLEFVKSSADLGLPADPELVEATMRATRRGSDLVRRLLAFARLAPLAAEPARADQLVLDTLRLLQRTLGEKVDIETRLEAGPALVRVDRNQFINALVNVALNARDAMPEGGTLTISTVCRKSPWADAEGAGRWPTGEEVCVTVDDTGGGMPEEVRGRATEPFFTTKPEGLGAGLGLNTVLGFVEQAGGHLAIVSEVGKGTTVNIHLPRIENEADVADGTPVFPEPAQQRGKSVLLVEDDPDVRVITAAQLKSLGYQVYTAADAHEAITVMESPTRIDVILTDIVLPGGIDGLTLVKEALRTRPGMGVLCMSGYDPGRNHRKWLAVQNIGLLEKPFTGAQLASALNEAIVQPAS